MDEKIQLGPRAQVTWVKGSSGGAKASDSGNNSAIVFILTATNKTEPLVGAHIIQNRSNKNDVKPATLTQSACGSWTPHRPNLIHSTLFLNLMAELSRTAGLNRYSALQSTPSPQPSSAPPQNSDFESRRSLGR